MRREEGERIVQDRRHNLHNENARRRSRRLAPGVIGVCLVMIVASSLALVLVPGARASPTPFNSTTVKVPCGASIQAAINAAHSGETILLASCTYSGALTIDKSVNIVGTGAGTTIITSPAMADPLTFGNPWTIVIGNAATVTLSGFTLLVTLQCIISSPYAASSFQVGYAGGGIGVGGSATLNLYSAVVTTTGATQGGSCGENGFASYGTGVAFGLDYVVGTPTASQLIGFGTVSGVAVSGFGIGGPGIAVGGTANSPAGSSASISHDQILTLGRTAPCCANPLPTGVGVGLGANASSATIVDNMMSGVAGTSTFPVIVVWGSSAYIAHNSLISTGWANGVTVEVSASATITDNYIAIAYSPWCGSALCGVAWGIFVYSAQATITHNSITGPSVDGIGIYLWNSTVTVKYNSISQMTCEYNATFGAPGATCGPSFATQYAGYGIFDYSDAGLGTVITNNLIFDNDGGVVLDSGCSACVVQNNVLLDNLDYGLAGIDGSYTFGPNVVYGGAYGVASIAFSVDTTVTLSHVEIVAPSVAPFYYEVDFTGGTATITGT